MMPSDHSTQFRVIDGVTVHRSDEAGGYYCEHLLFAALDAARCEGGVVGVGPAGSLVGFLHVPDDEATYSATHGSGEWPGRHNDTISVVARALRGLTAAVGGNEVRILLTGFGAFRAVMDNPTGAFVADHSALVDTMARAWPGAGVDVGEDEGGVTLGVRSAERHVAVRAVVLPVDDTTIAPEGPSSVVAIARRWRAQVVLCLGVVADRDLADRSFRVETRATDRRLRCDGRVWSHDEAVGARKSIRTEALWAALEE